MASGALDRRPEEEERKTHQKAEYKQKKKEGQVEKVASEGVEALARKEEGETVYAKMTRKGEVSLLDKNERYTYIGRRWCVVHWQDDTESEHTEAVTALRRRGLIYGLYRLGNSVTWGICRTV